MPNPNYGNASQFEKIDAVGNALFPTNVAFIPAGQATDVVIKALAGRLYKIAVTVAGTAADQLFDNASAGSGSMLFSTKAAPALADVYDFGTEGVPFANGLTFKGAASTSGITVWFS